MKGSVNRRRFLRYLADTLLPWMEPYYNVDGSRTGRDRSVLIMDNCTTQHCEACYQLCIAARVKLIFLPQYTPQWNPIELAFHTFKTQLRRLRMSLQYAKNDVVMRFVFGLWKHDVTRGGPPAWVNFIRHAGYHVQDQEA